MASDETTPILIFWEDAQGQRYEAEAQAGDNLMELACWIGVPGIEGECGGELRCATCHVIVAEPWRARLPAASAEEEDMLSAALAPAQTGSRLSCQLRADPVLDGLLLRLPSID